MSPPARVSPVLSEDHKGLASGSCEWLQRGTVLGQDHGGLSHGEGKANEAEDFSEPTLGRTARGPRGPNCPQVAPNFALCPIGFPERMEAQVVEFEMHA